MLAQPAWDALDFTLARRIARPKCARRGVATGPRRPVVAPLFVDALLHDLGYRTPSTCPDLVEVIPTSSGHERFTTRNNRRKLRWWRGARRLDAIRDLLSGVEDGGRLVALVRPVLYERTGYDSWRDRGDLIDATRLLRGLWLKACMVWLRDLESWERAANPLADFRRTA